MDYHGKIQWTLARKVTAKWKCRIITANNIGGYYKPYVKTKAETTLNKGSPLFYENERGDEKWGLLATNGFPIWVEKKHLWPVDEIIPESDPSLEKVDIRVGMGKRSRGTILVGIGAKHQELRITMPGVGGVYYSLVPGNQPSKEKSDNALSGAGYITPSIKYFAIPKQLY